MVSKKNQLADVRVGDKILLKDFPVHFVVTKVNPQVSSIVIKALIFNPKVKEIEQIIRKGHEVEVSSLSSQP